MHIYRLKQSKFGFGRVMHMKSTGIVRKIDNLGRVVLPIELRRTFDLNKEDPVEIFLDDEFILLKKYQPSCIFCNEASDVISFNGKLICKDCLEKINDIAE